jgi:hypothetical protein
MSGEYIYTALQVCALDNKKPRCTWDSRDLGGGPCTKTHHTRCTWECQHRHRAHLSRRRFGDQRHLQSAQIRHWCLVYPPPPHRHKPQPCAAHLALRRARQKTNKPGGNAVMAMAFLVVSSKFSPNDDPLFHVRSGSGWGEVGGRVFFRGCYWVVADAVST